MKFSFRKPLVFLSFLAVVAFTAPGNLPRAQSPAPSNLPKALPRVQNQAAATPSPTALRPASTNTPLPPVLSGGASRTLYAFIEAPRGPLTFAYVTISGFHTRTFTS